MASISGLEILKAQRDRLVAQLKETEALIRKETKALSKEGHPKGNV